MNRIKSFSCFNESFLDSDFIEEIDHAEYMNQIGNRNFPDKEQMEDLFKLIYQISKPLDNSHYNGFMNTHYENDKAGIFIAYTFNPDYEIYVKYTNTSVDNTSHRYFRIDIGFGMTEAISMFIKFIL